MVDQTHYVADVSLTKLDLPDEELSDHPELVTEFRSGIGSLQWMSGTARGDLSVDTLLLQKPPKDLTVGDLREVNKVLKYGRRPTPFQGEPAEPQGPCLHRLRRLWLGECPKQQKPRWVGSFGIRKEVPRRALPTDISGPYGQLWQQRQHHWTELTTWATSWHASSVR